MAKTIAISTEYPRKGGDVWQDVVGVDISLDEAVRLYARDWSRWDRQDQKDTKLAYVSIAPVPDAVPDPDDCCEFNYYEETFKLPAFWEETTLGCQDVVKDGKLVVAE